jgi:hypothetical protein
MPGTQPDEPEATPTASQPGDSTIPSVQPPDVNSDRVLGSDAQPESKVDGRRKTPPLRIREIETLEDDSKGG